MGASVIYNPYTNSGWKNHPKATTQQNLNSHNRDLNARPYGETYSSEDTLLKEKQQIIAKSHAKAQAEKESFSKSNAIIQEEQQIIAKSHNAALAEKEAFTKPNAIIQEEQQIIAKSHNAALAEKDAYIAQTKKNKPEIKKTVKVSEASSKNLPYAVAYVRTQVFNGINSPAEALKQGTAFSELYRPYSPKKGGRSHHGSNE